MKFLSRLPLMPVLLCAFALCLCIYPAESAAAAREGITLCLNLLIPSLFPFFVCSSLFIALGLADLPGKLLNRWMRPLFGVGGSCVSALLLGAVGGYPVGLRCLDQLYHTGQCSREDTYRLSAYCNNCGPAFILGVAGAGIFCSSGAGLLLLLTHLGASVLVGLLFRFYHPPRQKSEAGSAPSPVTATAGSFTAVFPSCVRGSFSSTLNVCAYVILFSVVIRLTDCTGLLALLSRLLLLPLPPGTNPGLCRSFVAGILELSTGIGALQGLISSPVAFPLAAFLLGWGGLSVHCQSLPFLQHADIPPHIYLTGKFLQGVFAALLAFLAAPLLPALPEAASAAAFSVLYPGTLLLQREGLALWIVSGIFFLIFRKKGGKNSASAL